MYVILCVCMFVRFGVNVCVYGCRCLSVCACVHALHVCMLSVLVCMHVFCLCVCVSVCHYLPVYVTLYVCVFVWFVWVFCVFCLSVFGCLYVKIYLDSSD